MRTVTRPPWRNRRAGGDLDAEYIETPLAHAVVRRVGRDEVAVYLEAVAKAVITARAAVVVSRETHGTLRPLVPVDDQVIIHAAHDHRREQQRCGYDKHREQALSAFFHLRRLLFSEDAAGMVFVPRRYRIISSFGALVMFTFPSPVR